MTMDTSQISWLALERYFLGELEQGEKARVELALEYSGDLRRCLEKIRADVGRPVQPLPSISAAAARSSRDHRVHGWRWRETWRSALALTAGLLAAVGGWNVWNRAAVHQGERLKGDQLSVQLVRHSGGAVAEDASVFGEGDLFKVRVTCSRAGAVSWQVSVFQGGEVFFPLSSAEPLHCGNQVLLPGAFRLTGAAPVIVCLGLEEDVVPRERLSKEGIGALPATASCTHVRPLPHP
jgi:hypothetical protein